uniref:Uncharacterized protein n=1 Tax=Caenorhabditis tropicalis TaxID=1561998 RepID=A0A1I7TBU8_9PELO
MQRMNLFLTTIFTIFFIFHTVEARFERVGFVSDPVKLLLQDSYSSLKNRMYSQKLAGWKKPSTFRQVRDFRKFI